ncbi:hypothetical protein GCK72_006342 [Caenorhabditis remanei]|uniref:Uncharacterized protein n=1 Tax=Caenorhabditis remanei TaxID=31234 RepID=A0A6A5HG00_CAERE|nr:hypothetical protein GCK72_006342 [Caenorhabditis remanei]KAF1766385.1 hypothetical protein GCK72_006342 [Caenorhabditis remanei]
MDRRRDPRYKQQEPAHHYDDRYNATYDNYDYEEDYGNQYANTVPHHHHPHPHAHPHHPEDHGYDDEDDHWGNQRDQHDFYDTVPATNLPPVKPMGPPKNLARVQISTSMAPMEPENVAIPQAPPPPRFGPTGGYNNNNDRKTPVSKYGNMATTDLKNRRETSDVHIRFDPAAKRDFPPKQTAFIDGFRNGDTSVPAGKKKETGGQTTNTIRSIINNLKSGGTEKQEDTIPRSRVSTNPFMRANQQQQQQQQHLHSQNHNTSRFEAKNTSKNVAEVVEKMNNGDWPIQIEDEESITPPLDPKRGHQQQSDKARQWETLHRKKDEKRSILEDIPHLTGTPPAPPLPVQQPPPSSQIPQKQQHPQMQKQQSREENDKMSDKSHEEEHTSVSTDSALCSESSEIRGPSPYKLPFDSQKPGELAEEAEKLLFYFKTHKEVLNYLGIGLTDRLWKHIQKLPNFETSIRVFKKQEEISASKPPPAPPINQIIAPPSTVSSNVPPAPKITISQSFAPQDRKSPIGHSHNRSVSQNEELSPQPNGFGNDESRFTKNLESSTGNNRGDRSNNGGRFVKKSAAALIAKKQGMQSEDPNSATEIIDPRIAEEIKNLRDREEELKRSRSELALVTSPPPSSYQMSPKKTSPGSNMRSAQSYDHLDNSIRSPIERSHSSHNVYHMKNAMNGGDSSPYHLGGAYGNANYGSMPRAQHRKEGSYHPQMHEHRTHDGGYRQSRNGEFFRQTPAASETTNAGWQKSAASFETKPSVAIHSGLQLPTANISISSYQQRSSDKYQNPKSMYGTKQHDAHRKIGL